ncbi:capping protein (actin filament), gelsolin-like a isoform X1 [Silurus meridionalis]|uniref:capping protein (actin filament), gelsolin-like a isoform X1 n=1 Tax=Silurus meridionalis TaxID=175797 RepID=UPI001EEACDF7|nr:capping protein (actin filament), gelsolin-like a isoform X1 [Silurus meridionalis]XP_046695609.1 capping protein (actin filament), gelsolin-like a isoform X1 [Silurus meridionalis]XP_046695610.1 capping protein (actin filament), gelsolin-like a isoform X1 [Silurus meridionalis]XP_046695611.1 capping protein (actin filament), gelsolin-like a isoform X1 [Silurus meridionalis]
MFPVSVCVFGDGVYGWRVEKMEAVQMDSRHLGVFYTGDSYIIVNKHSEGVELHMWMGEESSRDEQCTCAMLATQLLQFLRRDAVQHRQEQGHETDDFMKLFPNGVSYKRGGVESGFRRVQPECVSVRCLYQVKGRRNICVREVEPNWRSFNTGDCFILDLGQLIISWSGCKSSVFERQKVHQIAALIRDTERKGKAHINDVTQGEEPLEMVQVLGPIPVIKDSFEEDADADRTNSASLFKVRCFCPSGNRVVFGLQVLKFVVGDGLLRSSEIRTDWCERLHVSTMSTRPNNRCLMHLAVWPSHCCVIKHRLIRIYCKETTASSSIMELMARFSSGKVVVPMWQRREQRCK